MGGEGPGPGAYGLPPTIGYNKHDISKPRNPQYTMSPMTRLFDKTCSPGPQYNVEQMNQFGRNAPPAYTMAKQVNPLRQDNVPGPGTYCPEKVPRMKERRPPVYSMSKRTPYLTPDKVPGPNAYNLPSGIGPKVPNKKANPSYTMAKQVLPLQDVSSPGPAQYGGINTNVYKNKQPQYSMAKQVPPLSDQDRVPGPATYLPNLSGKKGPQFSFGIRHAEVAGPYIIAEDYVPCKD